MIGLDPAASFAASAALALVFAQAALHKLRDLRAFVTALDGYALLPATLAPMAAAQAIVAELLLASTLVVPPLRPAAALGALALLALYSAAIAVNLARGRREIDCGCTGPALRQPLSGWLLARNAALAAVALCAALPNDSRELSALDALPILGGAAALLALYAAANQLAANASTSQALRAAHAQRGSLA